MKQAKASMFTANTVTDVHRKRQRTCRHCKASFTAARATAKYCSDDCRSAAFRARQKPRQRTKARPADVLMRCVHCGQPFKASGQHSRLYCGGSCKTLAYRARKTAAIEALAALSGTSVEIAADSVDRHGMTRVGRALAAAGFIYDYAARAWFMPTGKLIKVSVSG